MTNPGSLVYDVIDKLSKQPGTIQEYEDLYIMLRNLSRDELGEAVSEHNLLDIFNYIDLSNGKYSEVALNIAVIIFSTFRLTEFAHSHENELLMSITSKNLPLRDFVISRLTDGLENSHPEDIDIPTNIVLEISKIAATEEIISASTARAFLLAFGKNHPNGVKILLENEAIKSYFGSLTSDEIIIRISEIFAYIASKRREAFGLMIKNATFDHLISFLNKDDALLVLNTLAVFKVLLEFPEGREFLLSSGAVDFSLSSLQDLKANPLHDFLLPGYLSFLATMAEKEPSTFLSNHISRERLVTCLATYLSTSHPIITTSVIEAVAQICRTLDGKIALAEYLEPGKKLSPVFSKASEAMQNASADTLPRIISAVSDMLNMPIAAGKSTTELLPIAEMTHGWFVMINTPLRRIWDLAKQPFKEVRAAGLKLLSALATEPWAVSLFAKQPGFLDYLCDPTTEVGTAVEGSSLQPEKFKIIESLNATQEHWLNQTNHWPLLDEEAASRVKQRVKDGIWGQVRAQAAVAMDNE